MERSLMTKICMDLIMFVQNQNSLLTVFFCPELPPLVPFLLGTAPCGPGGGGFLENFENISGKANLFLEKQFKLVSFFLLFSGRLIASASRRKVTSADEIWREEKRRPDSRNFFGAWFICEIRPSSGEAKGIPFLTLFFSLFFSFRSGNVTEPLNS